MRLWHQDLLPKLPYKQLLGQHRECAALRGNGWGKKHSTVDYVFTYHPIRLAIYHLAVIKEMMARGYHAGVEWKDLRYRGQNCEPYTTKDLDTFLQSTKADDLTPVIYPEHDKEYLQECLDNLQRKHAILIEN